MVCSIIFTTRYGVPVSSSSDKFSRFSGGAIDFLRGDEFTELIVSLLNFGDVPSVSLTSSSHIIFSGFLSLLVFYFKKCSLELLIIFKFPGIELSL
jgi:hypothetical protein